jgi:hypothetical protein
MMDWVMLIKPTIGDVCGIGVVWADQNGVRNKTTVSNDFKW